MLTNFYLDFENKFRGDRETVLNTLSIYDQLIELIVDNNPSPKLIDIGCGRGEWLQKYNHKFDDICGIESNKDMIKICREHNLNVIEGDAIDILSKFENQSVNVITLFHIIEHLEYPKLIKLLKECERVMKNDGLLIAETPNIDNFLVSTKSFYIDPTHVNPIHSDLIAFDLERIGFSNVKTYDINCGPLENASPLKITRVLNGVAQDLCIIATKTTEVFENLMMKSTSWETHLTSGITTLKAAVEHDLKLEQLLNDYKKSLKDTQKLLENNRVIIEKQVSKLDKLDKEIIYLKSQLKLLLFISKLIRKILRPFKLIFLFCRKLILIACNNIFNFFIRYQILRDFLISKRVLRIINFLLNSIKGSSSITTIQIQNKVNKLLDRDTKFILQNKKLSLHHRLSSNSKFYKDIFTKKR